MSDARAISPTSVISFNSAFSAAYGMSALVLTYYNCDTLHLTQLTRDIW
jgi:hypothetical protein